MIYGAPAKMFEWFYPTKDAEDSKEVYSSTNFSAKFNKKLMFKLKLYKQRNTKKYIKVAFEIYYRVSL